MSLGELKDSSGAKTVCQIFPLGDAICSQRLAGRTDRLGTVTDGRSAWQSDTRSVKSQIDNHHGQEEFRRCLGQGESAYPLRKT